MRISRVLNVFILCLLNEFCQANLRNMSLYYTVSGHFPGSGFVPVELIP